ncbi:MAG: STAS domain-containing protein [Butyrivibrio sp.]|nr:STAS domain-containing protein [Butyrivibrio sp.]
MAEIVKEINGTTMNIALSGTLNSQNSPELQKSIMESVADVTEINFDFADLQYLTSAGLRVILVAQQEMDDKNGKMTLKNVCDDIMEIFKMTGFLNILTIIN